MPGPCSLPAQRRGQPWSRQPGPSPAPTGGHRAQRCQPKAACSAPEGSREGGATGAGPSCLQGLKRQRFPGSGSGPSPRPAAGSRPGPTPLCQGLGCPPPHPEGSEGPGRARPPKGSLQRRLDVGLDRAGAAAKAGSSTSGRRDFLKCPLAWDPVPGQPKTPQPGAPWAGDVPATPKPDTGQEHGPRPATVPVLPVPIQNQSLHRPRGAPGGRCSHIPTRPWGPVPNLGPPQPPCPPAETPGRAPRPAQGPHIGPGQLPHPGLGPELPPSRDSVLPRGGDNAVPGGPRPAASG